MNGTADLTWGPLAKQGTFDTTAFTCTGSYCHGGTLVADAPGKVSNRVPIWNKVDGSQAACGSSCHTLPPGGTHPASDACPMCHAAVIGSFDPATTTATWADPSKHINGTVEVSKYHDLANWTAPKGDASHHGSYYFIQNQQRDEHALPCTQCHGADYNGGTSGVSCNNPTCHGGQDWKSCSFCHGTPPNQNNPPLGVGGETAKNTLAVGRHVEHLTASNTHVAFACGTCHTVPAAGDMSHAAQYAASADLTTAGHHGDVTLAAPYAAMTWNVAATQGNPATARGTCVGSCHSNGNGGPPVMTPYWAGGAWTVGGCGTCHAASPTTNRHNKHVNGEGMACTECHPAANTSSHLNGAKDVLSTIHGTVTTSKPGSCNGAVACTGSCHGENHNPFCWND